MGEHTVTSFDEELDAMDTMIRTMGERAAEMVDMATRALLTGDVALAQRVISEDRLMDQMQRDLDDRAVMLIGKRQPMGQDLRFAVGAMRMAGDLERIGDLAKSTCKRVGSIGEMVVMREPNFGIEKMAGLARSQVKAIIDVYVGRRADEIEEIRNRDEQIDMAYTSVFRELLTYMMEDPRKISSCTHLLFCAKNIERIGDHVTNIAENAYYMITGDQLPMARPKVDNVAEGIG
ncbi:MAG: phosphate transport system regulatory protein PhoU [Phyllobacteriaceae bacterium]|nr:phosphate transport system regulatory protein PhoU [Phyllobacteriaceae bacterium]MBA91514.1 phosphate transport system regulatory protein PhoU [Phyllobacteriaceae bacterium]